MKQKLVDEIRQTYILLYEKDDVRYIFNRSVKWNAIMNTKNIEYLIQVLGKEAISHFIINQIKNTNKLTADIGDLTETFVYDDTVFYILEVHPEFENIKRSDQMHINELKHELCKKYNAVDRKDKITGDAGLDLQISNILKKKFKYWLVDVYNAISEYSHLIYDETVKTTLWLTKEKLLEEINDLRNDKIKLEKQYKDNQKLIYNQKKILTKQNYVIDKFNRYINNLDENEVIEFKKLIINNDQYEFKH